MTFHSPSALPVCLAELLTSVVDLPESEYVQQRQHTAVGQVEPHQSMCYRVTVHRHYLFQGRQCCTPLRLDGREVEREGEVKKERGTGRVKEERRGEGWRITVFSSTQRVNTYMYLLVVHSAEQELHKGTVILRIQDPLFVALHLEPQ